MDVCKSCGKPKRKKIIDPATAKRRMQEGVDPYDDPDQPVKMSVGDAAKAADRIKDFIKHTAISKSHISSLCEMDIYLKPECFQFCGSFAGRSVRNVLTTLTADQKKNGVVCATTGNVGVSLSYHAQQLKIKIVVFIPEHTQIIFTYKMEKFGSKVISKGKHVNETKIEALKYAADNDMFYLGIGHVEMIAGAATIAEEILQEVPDVDVVIFPIGSGSLISGNAKVLKSKKPDVKIYGVESETCPSFFSSLQNGKITEVDKGTWSVAESSIFPKISANAFATGKKFIDKILVLNDEFISVAMTRLIELDKIVTEGAGALSVAAILSHKMNEFKGKKLVCVLSGGNIDTSVLCRAIDKGIAAEGRYVKIKCWLANKVGACAEFCKVCEDNGGDIKYVIPETCWLASDVFTQSLKLIVFTKSYEDSLAMKSALEKAYEDVKFEDFKMQNEPYPLF